jgi:uncharacterized membrane protein
MLVLLVLISSILILRTVGQVGVESLDSWAAATRGGLAVMLVFTASAHFTKMKEDLVAMVPTWIPWPRAAVYFTGVCELLGGIGLLVPNLRAVTGVALILFFILVFPANVKAALKGATLRGKPATSLWLRAPMQLLFIVLTGWSTQYA